MMELIDVWQGPEYAYKYYVLLLQLTQSHITFSRNLSLNHV